MEKINITELLKDCPSGMELDCTCADNVVFDKIIEYEQIKCVIGECRDPLILDKYGRLLHICCPKCVIFPKGETTWEGFQKPFKDGDILATYLGSVFYLNTRFNTDEYYGCYVGIDGDGSFHIYEPFAYKECCGLATEEEKAKLFKAIKDNGYKWHAETKTLVKLIAPKFKVGDKIVKRNSISNSWIVSSVSSEYYGLKYHKDSEDIGVLFVSEQDDYELVPNKFDINTLKPFDKVLVRGNFEQKWTHDFFGFMDEEKGYPFVCVGHYVIQCIPFEGNEHLLGKTDNCDEYYKTWKE